MFTTPITRKRMVKKTFELKRFKLKMLMIEIERQEVWNNYDDKTYDGWKHDLTNREERDARKNKKN